MTKKNCHKWAVFICHKPEAEAFIVLRFNSETLCITINYFDLLFFLYSCKCQMTTHLHTRHRRCDVEASKTRVNAVHTYAWYKTSHTHAKALPFISDIDTHASSCTFFSPCGQSCGLTFSCWWCFFERKTFLARFFCLQWGEIYRRQVHMMAGLSGESCGRWVFGHGVSYATLVGGRICFTFFFRAIDGNVLQG